MHARRAPAPLHIVEETPRAGPQRAALYARVSSPKQKTVPAQLEACEARARERGWRIVERIADEGLQGDDVDRPGFQRIIALAELRQIDVVIVWKLDRLARSLAHAVAVEDLLHQEGVAIHSATEPIETMTPVGRFIFGNLANAAQLEKAIIRERATMGKYARALRGLWTESRVPFGYKRTRGGHLHPKAPEADVVRRLFAIYLDVKSYAETAHRLNEAGLSFRGEGWTQRRVRHILENEIYRGRYRMSGVELDIPKLCVVDSDTFAQASGIRRSKAGRRNAGSDALRDAAIERVFGQYMASLRGCE